MLSDDKKEHWRDFTTTPAWDWLMEELEAVYDDECSALLVDCQQASLDHIRLRVGKISGITQVRRMLEGKKSASRPSA